MKLFFIGTTFSLNDEIVPLMKEFFLKPFRKKEENYYQFAHEVDLDYNMFKFATEILTIQLACMKLQKITKHLFEQSQPSTHKKMEKFMLLI
jgi:hypothetical protein